jgi:16S rRNA processing protein RimM
MSDAWDDLVRVGTIARPHGIRGEVAVDPDTDFPDERFRPGAHVFVRLPRGVEALTIASSRPHGSRWLVRFEGIETMTDAEPFRRAELRVPEQMLPPLPAGTYYRHDLIGCRVTLESGEPVGVVSGFDEGAGSGALVVSTPDGEVLLPLVSTICRSIDLAARTIVVEPPEGLLDLNATGRRSRSAMRR